jgi:amino acid transporter
MVMALGFILLIQGMNAISLKSSKALGSTGMIIKILPLIFMIASMFVFMGTADYHSINDPIVNQSINGLGEHADENPFSLLILSIPAVLFAFDGFIFSASMQNEAKSQKTFM